MYSGRKNWLGFITVCIVIMFIINVINSGTDGSLFKSIENTFTKMITANDFKIIASESVRFFENDLKDYAKKNKFKISIDYKGDLEIVETLNSKDNNYDAVWISNSIWLYMLDNTSLVTDSKSIAIDPVVMAIKDSKAKELGFKDTKIKNSDILKAIQDKKLNYVMTSVTKTNTGATAYLGFLNSLAGNPEVLKSEMLESQKLIDDLKSFFKGVERTSGDEAYLIDMFKQGNYEAMINYESTIIELNKELVSNGQEPLYLIYPEDGVAINDLPFGYVQRNQERKDKFEILQKYLRSQDVAKKLENHGLRTWYGGTSNSADNSSFKNEWGINTNEYLMPLKYPSKKVMSEALNLYVNELRKPSHTIFVVDVSGSMSSNDGLSSLKDSLVYLFDGEQASKDMLQFSKNDKITVIPFNNRVTATYGPYFGNDTGGLINNVKALRAGGGTNIYDPVISALKILADEDKDEYTTTVILMTDGESNDGTYSSLERFYRSQYLNIPVYSIMFGSANKSQLNDIAKLTNGKIFNGKEGLKQAFKEVRSYN